MFRCFTWERIQCTHLLSHFKCEGERTAASEPEKASGPGEAARGKWILSGLEEMPSNNSSGLQQRRRGAQPTVGWALTHGRCKCKSEHAAAPGIVHPQVQKIRGKQNSRDCSIPHHSLTIPCFPVSTYLKSVNEETCSSTGFYSNLGDDTWWIVEGVLDFQGEPLVRERERERPLELRRKWLRLMIFLSPPSLSSVNHTRTPMNWLFIYSTA